METISTQATPNTTGDRGTSAAPQRKGGFVQGAAVAQGCCGETSTGSSGCCGAPAQAAAPAMHMAARQLLATLWQLAF